MLTENEAQTLAALAASQNRAINEGEKNGVTGVEMYRGLIRQNGPRDHIRAALMRAEIQREQGLIIP